MRFDAAIVGGGISGLTCAAVLARQGWRIVLVEQAPQLAPLVRGFTRRGLYFDTGFHYAGAFGDGEILERLCRHLGLDELCERRVASRPEGFDLVRCAEPAAEFAFPCGWDRLKAALQAAFPAQAAPLATYVADVRRIFEQYPDALLRGDLGFSFLFQHLQGPSLQQYLDQAFGDQDLLKLLLAAHGVLYGGEPHEVSFAHHALIAGSYYQSAHTLRGGGRAIADAFARRLGALGVTVRCGAAVRRVRLTSAGAVAGVELATGEVIEAERCLVTTHPRQLLGLVPRGAFRPAFRHRVQALEDTCSGFLLYGRRPAGTPRLQGANLLLFASATAGLQRAASRPPRQRQRPMFLAASGDPAAGAFVAICPASWNAARRWAGPRGQGRGPGYAEWKARAMAGIAARLQQTAGDIVGGAEFVTGATPLTFRHYTGTPCGSLYGVKHGLGQPTLTPPTRVPNLYLSGQAVVMPGLLGAMLAGFVTCAAALGAARWQEEMRAWR